MDNLFKTFKRVSSFGFENIRIKGIKTLDLKEVQQIFRIRIAVKDEFRRSFKISLARLRLQRAGSQDFQSKKEAGLLFASAFEHLFSVLGGFSGHPKQ